MPGRPRSSAWSCTCVLVLVTGLMAGSALAQGVRDRTRLNIPRDTEVNETQAIELTLTVSETGRRPLQTWVRTAGTLDETGRGLVAELSPAETGLVRVGQRVRAFPPESKSSIYQAKVTRVTPRGDRAEMVATIPVQPTHSAAHYVMEIIVDRGLFLAVPNEAIIEEGDRQVVYLQQDDGRYVPREIHTGLKGEIYAEVLHGLVEGDRVVTFGSFFIDAEYKLKETEQNTTGNAHHNH